MDVTLYDDRSMRTDKTTPAAAPPAADEPPPVPRPYAEQGRRMREARESLDIDQAEMARRVDVEPQTYWRYEVGERSPKRTRMERIAGILGRAPEYFTRGEEPPKQLSRGQVLEMIEDELGLSEAQKARMRLLLGKFKHHRVDVDYLEAAADLVKYPDVTDETVHATAVTIATNAQARETSARKLGARHESDAPHKPRRTHRTR